MNKIMAVVAICIEAFAMNAAAQTNTFPASGNVGIGTTAPQSQLNVSSLNTNPGPVIFAQETVGSINGSFGVGSSLTSGHSGFLVWDDSASPYLSLESFSGASPVQIKGSQLWLNPGGGNVGIGTTAPGAPLEVNGSVKLTSGSGGSITFQDGTAQSTAYTGVTCGGDYAESVDVTGDRKHYEPGDVLVIDSNTPGKFLKSAASYSTSVSGIYSTKPGTVGRRQTTVKNPDEVPMAVMGIVPAKVSAENGAIRPGDLLVSSSKLGYAMKGTDRSQMLGAVIGKAMGNLDSGTGVIEVLVTLQ
jgi:hypothetical protein